MTHEGKKDQRDELSRDSPGRSHPVYRTDEELGSDSSEYGYDDQEDCCLEGREERDLENFLLFFLDLVSVVVEFDGSTSRRGGG